MRWWWKFGQGLPISLLIGLARVTLIASLLAISTMFHASRAWCSEVDFTLHADQATETWSPHAWDVLIIYNVDKDFKRSHWEDLVSLLKSLGDLFGSAGDRKVYTIMPHRPARIRRTVSTCFAYMNAHYFQVEGSVELSAVVDVCRMTDLDVHDLWSTWTRLPETQERIRKQLDLLKQK